ncbi:MAG: NUDIX hydrolase, partial [Planctomycetota bacterium]
MKLEVCRVREIFRGRVLRLVLRDVELPNGRRTTIHVVEHPGAVAILPVFENGDVLLLRQFRPSVGKELFEIPAGTLEPGERPLATARREIVEETGYRARSWRKLATFYTAPGFCTELMHLYVARDLRPAQAQGDPDEIIRTARMPLPRALELARRGRVRDAKSLVGLLWYAH